MKKYDVAGLLREGSVYVRLNNLHGSLAAHLEDVIYKTERGAIMHNGTPPVGTGSANSADMLTLALRSQVDERRVKVMTWKLKAYNIFKLYTYVIWYMRVGFVFPKM